ncbi:MAG TPA: PEGA domain-containing protein [Polyangiaceae bacterium]|nr:PEGA domain-containing protein [Polyangiaceae bacterium]
MRTYRCVVLLMLIAKTAIGSGERESPPSAQQKCFRKAKQALHVYRQHDAQAAFTKLHQLWSTDHCHQVAALLGQTELALEKYREAAEHLSFALRDSNQSEPAKRHEEIATLLARAKAKVGTLQIRVNAPSAEIAIDGELIGKAPFESEHFVEPGRHQLRASRASFGAVDLKFDIKPGEQQPIDVRLSTQSEPLLAASKTQTPSRLSAGLGATQVSAGTVIPDRRNYYREKVIVLIGGGAIAATAVGAGVYFQVQGNQSRDRAKQLSSGLTRCSEPPEARCVELRDAVDERGRNYTTAKVLYGVGAAVGLSTTILAFVLPSQAPTSDRAAVKGWLSPSSAGIIVSGRF